MTIIIVDSIVVATDSEYELICTGIAMLFGINCGVTSKPVRNAFSSSTQPPELNSLS
jgi:hypothetical protein